MQHQLAQVIMFFCNSMDRPHSRGFSVCFFSYYSISMILWYPAGWVVYKTHSLTVTVSDKLLHSILICSNICKSTANCGLIIQIMRLQKPFLKKKYSWQWLWENINGRTNWIWLYFNHEKINNEIEVTNI